MGAVVNGELAALNEVLRASTGLPETPVILGGLDSDARMTTTGVLLLHVMPLQEAENTVTMTLVVAETREESRGWAVTVRVTRSRDRRYDAPDWLFRFEALNKHQVSLTRVYNAANRPAGYIATLDR